MQTKIVVLPFLAVLVPVDARNWFITTFDRANCTDIKFSQGFNSSKASVGQCVTFPAEYPSFEFGARGKNPKSCRLFVYSGSVCDHEGSIGTREQDIGTCISAADFGIPNFGSAEVICGV